MRLIIVSGLSGSGKSVALNTLEDDGFYCIDNLPTGLLLPLIERIKTNRIKRLYDRVAVGIDARSDSTDLNEFPVILDKLRQPGVEPEIVFLQTDLKTLIRRFSETRRKHPLSKKGMPLVKAIELERTVLAPLIERADPVIDTTQLTVHQLRTLIKDRLLPDTARSLSVLIQSFGFKHSLPGDTDFVFDVRCLPNPHWDPQLRPLTGKDPRIQTYLRGYEAVEEMYTMIRDFLEKWFPLFQSENRSYITVSIGCTGGQHRSVYLAEQLYDYFSGKLDNVSLRHRELE